MPVAWVDGMRCSYQHDGIGFRTLEREDLEINRRMRNDSSTWPNLTHGEFLMPADQERWFAAMSGVSGRMFLVACDQDHPFVGIVRMDELDRQNRSLRVGADVLPELRRRGYGTRIYRALLRYAFDELGMHRVWLCVLDTNTAGIGLYQKVGFQIEGTYREHVWRAGAWHDYIVMSILEHEYRRLLTESEGA